MNSFHTEGRHTNQEGSKEGIAVRRQGAHKQTKQPFGGQPHPKTHLHFDSSTQNLSLHSRSSPTTFLQTPHHLSGLISPCFLLHAASLSSANKSIPRRPRSFKSAPFRRSSVFSRLESLGNGSNRLVLFPSALAGSKLQLLTR